MKAGIHNGVLGEIFTLVHDTVDANRDTAETLVRDRSRWWIASRVDREVANLVVTGVLSVLEELRTDGSSLPEASPRPSTG